METEVCLVCGVESGSYYDMDYGEITIAEMIVACVPFVNMQTMSDPVLCADCYIFLMNSFLLNKKCMQANKKRSLGISQDENQTSRRIKSGDLIELSVLAKYIELIKAEIQKECEKQRRLK